MAKKQEDLTVIAVNPVSLLNTEMVQEACGKHWSPADKGADILVKLASSEEHGSISGIMAREIMVQPTQMPTTRKFSYPSSKSNSLAIYPESSHQPEEGLNLVFRGEKIRANPNILCL